MHLAEGAMSEKKRGRKLPRVAQPSTRDPQFFMADDAAELVRVIGLPLQIPADYLAAKLNALSGRFLEFYALLNDAPNSRKAEWCVALERDADSLLQKLNMLDRGYPESKLPLDVRKLLTDGPGIGAVFQDHQRHALGVHDDESSVCQALDEIAPALWKLRRAALNAAAGYQARAKAKVVPNAAKQQHDSFLSDLARVLEMAFNYRPPESRPGVTGKFPKAALFVSGRIAACVKAGPEAVTDQGTDHAAVAELLALTEGAIASQWARIQAEKKAAEKVETRKQKKAA
jgi:hypothetical protein